MNFRTVRGSGFLVILFLGFSIPVLSRAQESQMEFGKKYFEGKCARCHGKDGAGNAKMARLLNTPLQKMNLHRKEVLRMSVIQIEAMIDTGKHRMPKYRGKLTDSQIHGIASYVKVLTTSVNPATEKDQKPGEINVPSGK